MTSPALRPEEELERRARKYAHENSEKRTGALYATVENVRIWVYVDDSFELSFAGHVDVEILPEGRSIYQQIFSSRPNETPILEGVLEALEVLRKHQVLDDLADVASDERTLWRSDQ